MVEDLMTESSLTDLSQIGYRIRSEREKNGWSISEVSAYLRINEKILKAIEEGRTEEGIAPVFMRGFIRSYLRYLKLWDDSMDTPLQNTPELKQPEKAKEHLAKLDSICFFGCEEFDELKEAIKGYEKNN